MNFVQTKQFGFSILTVFLLSFPLISTAMPPAVDGFRHEVYSDTAAELFWQRSAQIHIQGYELTKNGNSLGVFDALSYFDDTLMPGVEYTYTISVVASSGERSTLSTVTLQTPQFADTIATIQQENSTLVQDIAELEAVLTLDVPSPVPQTGQTQSNHPGDDGDYQAGVVPPSPRFTINPSPDGDLNGNGVCDGSEQCAGTVTDNLTGLIWLQDANCFGAGDWFNAMNKATTLADDGSQVCGLTDGSQVGDWRVPNTNELFSLMDFAPAFPNALLPPNHPFTDVQIGGIGALPSMYWTSTTTVGSSFQGAYVISISVGWLDKDRTVADDYFVWYVRGGI